MSQATLLSQNIINEIQIDLKISKADEVEIIKRLFSKAPQKILKQKKTKELALIAQRAIEITNKLNTDTNVQIQQFKSNDASTCEVFILQPDSPFIIQTIQEELQENSIKPEFFLHPIISIEKKKFSLVYFEIDLKNQELINSLINQLESKLKILHLSTNDYLPTRAKLETLSNLFKNYASPNQEKNNEISDFIEWLLEDGFIFLAYKNSIWDKQEKKEKQELIKLGFFKTNLKEQSELDKEIDDDIKDLIQHSNLCKIKKLRIFSPVKNFRPLSHITFNEPNSNNIHSLLGIFTTKAFAQESSTVPLIRLKLQKLMQQEEVVENSYDHKTIIHLIDSMPVADILQSDLPHLTEIARSVLSIQNENETRVNIRYDEEKRGVSVLILLPRDRFNSTVRDRIQTYLENTYGTAEDSSDYHLDLSNKPHAKLFFYLPLASEHHTLPEISDIEAKVAELSLPWQTKLENSLLNLTDKNRSDIVSKYSKAFSETYKAVIDIDEALEDIYVCEKLNENNPIEFRVSVDSNKNAALRIYYLKSTPSLSKVLPMLEYLGLEVISENNWLIKPENYTEIFIQRFDVKSNFSDNLTDFTKFDTIIAPALKEIFSGRAHNDSLNALCVSAYLELRKLTVLRAYTKILWQIDRFTTRKIAYKCLSELSHVSALLFEYFDTKFNPSCYSDLSERNKALLNIQANIKQSLKSVSNITYDRVLRSILHLMEHSLRTNFYCQKTYKGLAIKLDSSKVEFMNLPRPLYEIFVVGIDFEGIHLRSGKIARGGLRWSERNEDYRTEVLSLMNTQRLKNALIVPTGAKGGFVLQNPPKERNELMQAVKDTYREFIRSLLSVTDNRVNEQVVHPADVIIHDQPDPYFVVAADKGTATFSDVANEIAINEFNFWLGDAFASGGSKGYDHKVSGITARGAWECTKRHFTELNINFDQDPFTVVGIGDLSGDVFGNGLLRSKNMKLIAAFNHQHIFIDPNPDIELAFKERQRMFALPRSSWTDYSKEVMSKGSAIYERSSKEIELSQEARTALGINSLCTFSGEELIQLILKAPVDLIWNGGIGTYVKSSKESNADAKDSTNDDVRVNAKDLRAKVVAEGGNLGFTQQARIEYAKYGGSINTDAIDNSGGVDLSDHEVNLKILFTEITRKTNLKDAERVAILREIEEDVVNFVLEHNSNHALLLTLGVNRSSRNIEYFRSLLNEMTLLGYINRTVDNLPEDEELIERSKRGDGLTRPELAICIAAVKNYTKNYLLETNLLNDSLLQSYLLEYFPSKLIDNYSDEIINHPLAKHIIASQLTNIIVDHMGVSFIHRMCLSNSCSTEVVIKCAIAAQLILNFSTIRQEVNKYDTYDSYASFIKLRKYTNRVLRDTTSWLVRNHGTTASLKQMVHKYQAPFTNLIYNSDDAFFGYVRERYKERLGSYDDIGLEKLTARTLAAGPIVVHIFETLWSAIQTSNDVSQVSQIYNKVILELDILNILKMEASLSSKDKWENELLINSFAEISRSISKLTLAVIKNEQLSDLQINSAIQNSSNIAGLKATIREIINNTSQPSPAALSVLAKQLSMFVLAE